jgi:condensin-2 complex subunit G2
MVPPSLAVTAVNVVEAALKSPGMEELAALGERMSAKSGHAGSDAVEALAAAPVAVVRSIALLLQAKAAEALQIITDGDDGDDGDDGEAAMAEGDDGAAAAVAAALSADRRALCHRALAAAAVVVRRVLEHCGDATPAVLLPAATLLHDTVLLASAFPAPAQDAVAVMCEAWWHSEKPGRENLVTKTAPYLVFLALSTRRATEVKRLNSMRHAFSMFDWDDDATILSLKKLLLRCAFAPQFLRSAEGRRFLSFLFTLHPGTTRDLMAIVRNQIPVARKSILAHYGDVLFRAWRCAGGECLHEIERVGVQGLADAALLASTPQMAASLRAVLCGFHAQKAYRGVDAMLLRLYEPILFRALSAANPAVRRNACSLLVDVFPLQDPEADVEVTDGLLARQAGIISQLMGDAAPAVRAAAVGGICRILNTFWELVPAPTTAAFLAKLVDGLARDAAASSVRAAVCEGLTRLVDNPLAQPVLRAVLPRLAPLIGDSAGRVRVALVNPEIRTLDSTPYFALPEPYTLIPKS